MEQQRRCFDSWPAFYQHTLFMRGPVLELRGLPLAERLAQAMALKDCGNERFKARALSEAIHLYEQAAGVFRYATNTDPDWKSKGLRDETIAEVDERGEPGTELHAQVVAFLVSCYSNLAAAYLGRAALPRSPAAVDASLSGTTPSADYALCIAACTTVLSLDPSCTKALYRRARARVEPLSAREGAVDAAIRDLSEAALGAPDDRAVRELLGRCPLPRAPRLCSAHHQLTRPSPPRRLRRDKASKREAEASTFAGMFNRGQIYDDDALASDGAASAGAGAEAERRVAAAQADVDMAEELLRALRSRGQRDDAEVLQAQLTERRRQLAGYRRAAGQTRAEAPIDFRNPTSAQRAGARQRGVPALLSGGRAQSAHGRGTSARRPPGPSSRPALPGVDLDDPLVLEELERLQHEMPHRGSDPAERRRRAAAAGSSGRPVRHCSARPPPPDVRLIPLSEIRRRLDHLGVDTARVAHHDRPALEALLLSQYRGAQYNGNPGRRADRRGDESDERSDDCGSGEEDGEEESAGGLRAALGDYCTVS